MLDRMQLGKQREEIFKVQPFNVTSKLAPLPSIITHSYREVMLGVQLGLPTLAQHVCMLHKVKYYISKNFLVIDKKMRLSILVQLDKNIPFSFF